MSTDVLIAAALCGVLACAGTATGAGAGAAPARAFGVRAEAVDAAWRELTRQRADLAKIGSYAFAINPRTGRIDLDFGPFDARDATTARTLARLPALVDVHRTSGGFFRAGSGTGPGRFGAVS